MNNIKEIFKCSNIDCKTDPKSDLYRPRLGCIGGQCYGCFTEKRRIYYQSNKEKIKSKKKVRYRDSNNKRVEWFKSYYIENRDKILEYNKQYRIRNKYKYNYNLSLADFFVLLVKQSGGCAICGTRTPSKKGFEIDHNHFTGKIRGLLCHNCNLAIGLFKENSIVIKKANTYITNEGIL